MQIKYMAYTLMYGFHICKMSYMQHIIRNIAKMDACIFFQPLELKICTNCISYISCNFKYVFIYGPHTYIQKYM